jgi:hypothetical protein
MTGALSLVRLNDPGSWRPGSQQRKTVTFISSLLFKNGK